jgi:hypothetical protein
MRVLRVLVVTIALIGSTASAGEPETVESAVKEHLCNTLGEIMYGAAWEASNRLDKDILATRAYRSAVTLENPEEKKFGVHTSQWLRKY